MDELIMERFALAKERIMEIPEENAVPEPYSDFFRKEAQFLQKTFEVLDENFEEKTLEELQKQNHALYEDVLEENYETSYGNPAYAQKMLGEYGKDFSFLYAELHSTIAYAFEHKMWDYTIGLELFLEVYSAFGQEELPQENLVRDILVSYVNDYCQDMMEQRIREGVDP